MSAPKPPRKPREWRRWAIVRGDQLCDVFLEDVTREYAARNINRPAGERTIEVMITPLDPRRAPKGRKGKP